MRDAKIITLYKRKGVRSNCNNYRGISLLSIFGKVFARVLLIRLQKLAESVYPESHCGFRAERSTLDMVFFLRQLHEKYREQQMPLYIAFIDLTKSFDLVSRAGLLKFLQKIGCPPRPQSMIEFMKGTVQFNSSASKPLDIRSGVKQGCVLAPTLFWIFFALLLKCAFDTTTEGIYMRSRSDDRLFNLAGLKAKTKVHEALIRDMLFADDATVATHTQQQLQSLVTGLQGLQADHQPEEDERPGTEHDAVHQFTYLSSSITDNLSLDTEIDKTIWKAVTTLTRLMTRVWIDPKLTVKIKMAVYNACVISTRLYDSETWTICARQERRRITTFHMRSIRRILGISRKDRVSNPKVAQAAQTALGGLSHER